MSPPRRLLLPIPCLALLLLSACSPSLPQGQALVQATSKSMARLSGYRLTGSSLALGYRTSYLVQVLQDGSFAGSLTVKPPDAAPYTSEVISLGERVWVRSPDELKQLGITSLPGGLDPATTWVLQPSATARSYRQSLEPFTGTGLSRTLRQDFSGEPEVRFGRLAGRVVLVVEQRGGGSSLRLFIDRASDHLLELAINGVQAISLRYGDFGRVPQVVAPPSSEVYVPPAQAASP